MFTASIGTSPARSDSSPSPKASASAEKPLAALALAALGVVFGDIATSPIYALRECFHGEYGIAATQTNVLGILSLIFWSLVLIVGIKYLTFVFRADNHGEGGVVALTALIRGPQGADDTQRRMRVISLGLFAGCLLFGDGMITPSISVLSAVEGIGIATPVFAPYTIPLTLAILVGLFLLQRHGTLRVGGLFGPVILIWLCFLAVTGVVKVADTPQVLTAIFPWYAFKFLVLNKVQGFVVLGAVFLVVTGTEALYADMGHFGTRPIRLTWFLLVLPSLLLNYFGQGALLLSNPGASDHPFYAMVPSWAMIPAVVLTTLATIIASQAVISGAFSLTRQAIQQGYLPRLRIRHTSASQIGQIYVAPINWMLMVCTVALVIGFQSSSNLAAAYGVAVTSTMIVTSLLFYVVARNRWHWSRSRAVSLTGLFLLMDAPFFLASISKLLHGAWFALFIGAIFFTIMLTWAKGRRVLAEQLRKILPPIHRYIVDLASHPLKRIEGDAVFLCGSRNVVPVALAKNVKHNRVIHSRTVFLHFKVEDVPRVPSPQKVTIENLDEGFYRIIARYGFMEDPTLETVLSQAKEQGLKLKQEAISFFIGRANLVPAENSAMARWQTRLFIFMSRNAADATSFFKLPPEQVIEVGARLEI